MFNLTTIPPQPSKHAKVVCKVCKKPYSLYYEGSFWCEDCGQHAQLIKLITRVCHWIDFHSPSFDTTRSSAASDLLRDLAKRNDNQQSKFDFFLSSVKRIAELEEKMDIVFKLITPEKRQQ